MAVDLDAGDASVDAVYAVMDWLYERQGGIEAVPAAGLCDQAIWSCVT
jgi:hypothetical protein